LKELRKAEEAIKLLLNDPEDKFFQTGLQMKLNNVLDLGNLLYKRGCFPGHKISTNYPF
jgi:hypothetical protein